MCVTRGTTMSRYRRRRASASVSSSIRSKAWPASRIAGTIAGPIRSRMPVEQVQIAARPRPDERPRIVGRRVERDVGNRIALAQQEADPLQIARGVRHDRPPRILVGVRAGRVEHPAGRACLRRRVRPAMTDQLVDAGEEVLVRFRLEIDRRGTERGGVQPRPRLGRGDRLVEEVRRRRGPARRRQRAPLEAFAVEDVGVARSWRASPAAGRSSQS